jgi:hypothetical protein
MGATGGAGTASLLEASVTWVAGGCCAQVFAAKSKGNVSNEQRTAKRFMKHAPE